MAISSKCRCCMGMAIIIIILSGYMMNMVSAGCESSLPVLAAQCSKFVRIPGPMLPPSAECCQAVKSVDISCVCKYVTPGVEKMISMQKVVYVVRQCGLVLQPGMKCGSYTVPPLHLA